ncbi:MAG: hypothetical protein HYV00_10700 [Deltaproteobacteria bacterium]|nr:hypothetical protein [Deltaproteobacteria bacterium]
MADVLYRKDMGQYTAEQPGLPETFVVRLASHLKRHALWDALLWFFPPLLVFSSIVIFLYHSAWVGRETLIVAGAPFVGLALLMGFLRFRAVAHSRRAAAHLIDERVEGKDRFITLATIQPSLCPPFLLARLRREASGLMRHLDLAGDFPYRIKRSFFQSLIGSLSVLLLVLLFQQIGSISAPPAPHGNELAVLAQRLSQIPRFSELARSLEVLATRMRDQGLSAAEKRSLIREVLERVESQLAAERQLGGAANDLLNQAAGALRGMEQGLEKGQGQGAGGLKNDQTGEGKGRGKDSGQKGSEKEQGELSALEIKEQKGGQPARGERQEMGRKQAGKNPGGGEKDESGKEKSNEVKGMGKEEAGGKGSKYMEGEIPSGKTAERFLRPGEQGEKGIKGARFITVELPEEEAGGSTGEGGVGKRRGFRPKVPISNAPLRPPDSPDAAPEKQPLPLEYRGLIR